MIIKEMTWVHVDRDFLSVILMDGLSEDLKLLREPNEELLRGSMVAIGFEIINKKVSALPSILLISGVQSREFFAWVSTYTPEIFPVSQHLRVMTLSDYNDFSFFSEAASSAKEHYSSSALACLVLGEVLAQVEVFDSLASLPISRAITCWTTPVARCFEVYGRRSVSEICLKRLSTVYNEGRFSKRGVGLEDIYALFSAFDSVAFSYGTFVEKARMVYEHMCGFEQNSYMMPDALSFNKVMESFETNSFEKRVSAFRNISQIVFSNSNLGQRRAAFIIALSAFLVGKGTTHVFLLKDWSRDFPSVYLWFGLISSFSEIESWSADWVKSVKLIEKILRPSFHIYEPSISDFYWLEFDWILKTYESNSFFNNFPKLSPGGVTVEVCPGVTYQCRFPADAPLRVKDELSFFENKNYIANDVKEIFTQFVNMSKRVENILSRSNEISKYENTDTALKNKIAMKKSKLKKGDA